MRDWWQPRLTLLTALLLPVSWLFGLVTALRRAFYRSGLIRGRRLAVPVIVAGNLTVGGSGKTPLVIALVEALAARGRRPGVVSRGYGATDTGAREVRPDSAPADCGDEPLLIRRRAGCPVFVGRDRPGTGRALLAAHPEVDVIIADDGLQHLALARNFAIAVFDERGAGNGRLLPAGPLREPLSRAGALDAVVVNGAGAAPVGGAVSRMRLVPQALYALVDPEQRLTSEEFIRAHGARIAAVAGIGSPARFFATLKALGFEAEEHPFADHHAYSRADLQAITAPLIVMTEKDAIKCRDFGDARIWVLPVAADIDPVLVDAIMERIRGPQTA